MAGLRRTAAWASTTEGGFATRNSPADFVNISEKDVDDRDVQRHRGFWNCACRKLKVPTASIILGVFVWLLCFTFVEDHFAMLVWNPSSDSETDRFDVESVTQDENHTNATGDAHQDHSDPRQERNNSNQVLETRQNWMKRLTGHASLPTNATAALRLGTERLKETGGLIKRRGEERLKSKQEELRRKRNQVEVASKALAGVISSGEVHREVVVGAVAAFIALAISLQVLASNRRRFRQFIKTLVTRSLPMSLEPNELVTRPYASWTELSVRVGLDFLNEPANLMLISIGSLQVLATWSKADPWRCKKINLLVLLLNFAYTLVQEVRAQLLAAAHDAEWNSSPCTILDPGGASEVIPTKCIQVGNLVRLDHGDLCPATGELAWSSHSSVLFNSLCETGEDCCSLLSVGDIVLRGFVLSLEGAEVIVKVTETRSSNRTASGASTSKKNSGEEVPPKIRCMERFPEHMNVQLAKANLVALTLLFLWSTLVTALAYTFGYSSSQPSINEDVSSHQNALSSMERFLVTHFFSAAVQLNTVIPSMRWVVLFFLFVFLIEAAQPDIRVQNWRAFRGMEKRRILYSDKTGTLTEVGMCVNRLRLVECGSDFSRVTADTSFAAVSNGIGYLEWLAAILMACNDAQARHHAGCTGSGVKFLGLRPGTSPEEIALAEHLEEVAGLTIKSNPLRPGTESLPSSRPFLRDTKAIAPDEPVHNWPLVLVDQASGNEVLRATVFQRSGFNPAAGCREAHIAIQVPGANGNSSEVWVVRQGGADIMAELGGRRDREAEMADEDQNRALGWAVSRQSDCNDGGWRYVLRASFANPPRASSARMVSHYRAHGNAIRMITGDACIAAVYIARQIGIVADCPEQDVIFFQPGESPTAFARRVADRMEPFSGAPVTFNLSAETEEESCQTNICVVVPGSFLRELLETDGEYDWLADQRVSAVIYRTRAADKALIVGKTEKFARSMQQRRNESCTPLACITCKEGEIGSCWMVGDAANDAEAISLEGVIGVSLQHGATPCKLGADFIVKDPGALIALRTELYSQALAGARGLLEDVCLISGLVSSLTFCGVWTAGFKFLPRGFLYDDPFDARLMTLFSGAMYPLSACSAACAWSVTAFVQNGGALSDAEANPARFLLLGTALGCLIGLAGPTDNIVRFGRYILTVTSAVCVVRHTFSPMLTVCRRPGSNVRAACVWIRRRALAWAKKHRRAGPPFRTSEKVAKSMAETVAATIRRFFKRKAHFAEPVGDIAHPTLISRIMTMVNGRWVRPSALVLYLYLIWS